MEPILVETLHDVGDARGASYSLNVKHLQYLGDVSDLHVATILPGQVRGNHKHVRGREILLIYHEDSCVLGWRDRDDLLLTRQVTGRGGVVVTVHPGTPHAIRNTGSLPLFLVGLTDLVYDAQSGETQTASVL